jgi:septum formation protein
MSKLILASASPRRSELLRSMGVSFETVPSAADEVHDEQRAAAHLCELNAERKAAEVSARFPNDIILGADTLVTLPPRIYGKPCDLTMAKDFLRELSGRTHEVITGVCLMQLSTARKSVFHDVTHVTFKTLSDVTIDCYITQVAVLDKAGAYAIQECGDLLVEKISGSFSNVVGLPTERLAQEFDRWSIPYSERSR